MKKLLIYSLTRTSSLSKNQFEIILLPGCNTFSHIMLLLLPIMFFHCTFAFCCIFFVCVCFRIITHFLFILLDETANPDVCCDTDQAETMLENFKMTAIFSRCPSCLNNLIAHLCVFSCGPNQADFIEMKTLSNKTGNIKPERKSKRKYVKDVTNNNNFIYF